MAIRLIIASNDVFWYCSSTRHNNYGPAIKSANRCKVWYVNNKLHRLGGPAIDRDTRKEWWVSGICHRLDGPAIEFADGEKHWFINGNKYTYLEYLIEVEQLNANKENI